MRDVNLAKLAEVLAVGVDHGGRVVVHAGQVLFVHRHDDHHLVLLGQVLHQLGRRPVGNPLGEVVPLDLLLGAEVRAVEQLLQADDLDALFGGLGDHGDVLVDHRLLDLLDRRRGRLAERGLNQSAADNSGHGNTSSYRVGISPRRHGGHRRAS